MFKHALPILLFLLLSLPVHAGAPTLSPRIVEELPHDTTTSTQGLFFHNGLFYESSGGYGRSFLAVVQPETGERLTTEGVASRYFAEGIAPHDGFIYLLTWKSGTGFIHDMEDFKVVSRFTHDKDTKTEGWGLTTNGTHLIRSSGTSQITFHRPEDFERITAILVTDEGKPVRLINELEFIEGRIFANIWKSDIIAVIEPDTGLVVAWIDLSELRSRIVPDSGTANGIAYDSATKRIFVTGKHWDKLFVIEVDGL